jgi:hypothetical protein
VRIKYWLSECVLLYDLRYLVGFCIYRICQECELNNSKIVIILSDLNGVVLGSKRKIPLDQKMKILLIKIK